jgi:hypothetical protein
MKAILAILVAVSLGAWTTAAQNSASVQAGASAQTQTSADAGKSGKQVSGSSSTTASGSASGNAGRNSVNLSDGTKINAALVGSLDARKSKRGDRVEARTVQDVKQDGKVVLKKGTVLTGHVTRVQARTKEQAQSQIGIIFDHAVLRHGEQVPLHATIQALAAAQNLTAASMGSDEMMASQSSMGAASGVAGGGLVGGVAATAGVATGTLVNTAGGVTSNAGGALNTAVHSTGTTGGLTSTGHLTSNSSGVFGLQGLSLDSAASSATQGSVIVSSNRNVHLGNDTQMVLSVSGQAH